MTKQTKRLFNFARICDWYRRYRLPGRLWVAVYDRVPTSDWLAHHLLPL